MSKLIGNNMADFDPQAYLAQKQALLQQAQAPAAFSPQAYLAKKQSAMAGPQELPGIPESLARGIEQGATFGFGDEINGALQAAKEKGLENSPEDIMDLYKKHRDESRAAMKLAETTNPIASGIGNIAGAALPAIASAGTSLAPEAGLAGAMKFGAATGALSGLGNSEATTLPGAASDVAVGGVLGGGLGAGLHGLAEGVLKPIGNTLADIGPLGTMGKAFSQGVSGRKLFGTSGAKAVNEEFGTTLGNASNTVQNALNESSASKAAALNGSPNQVDITDWVKGVIGGLKSTRANNPFSSDVQDLNKVQSLITDFVAGNPDLNIAGKGTMVDPRDLEMLKRKLGAMGTEGDSPLNTSVGKQFVNRLLSPMGDRTPNLTEQSFGLPDDFTSLKEVLNNHVGGLDEQNQRIHQLMTALDLMPNTNTVANAQNTTTAGLGASDKLNAFLGALPSDVSNQIGPQMADIGQAQNISNKIQTGGLSHSWLANSAAGGAYSGANAAGLAVGGIGRALGSGIGKGIAPGTYAATAAGTLRDMAPEALGSLAQNLKASGDDVGQKLGSVLEQASQRDQTGRNAILFTIEQNPLYRDAISKVTKQPGIAQQQ